MEGEPLHNPNGLYCLEDVLMVASSGDGQLKRIGMNDLEVTVIANGLNHADGIAKDSRGNYLVSNWEGQIFYIRPDGQMSKLLDTRDKKINSADIDLIVKEDMLIVPTFLITGSWHISSLLTENRAFLQTCKN